MSGLFYSPSPQESTTCWISIEFNRVLGLRLPELRKPLVRQALRLSLRGPAIHCVFQCCHSAICWLVFIILHRDTVKINEIEFVKYFISSSASPVRWTFRSLIIHRLYGARTLKLLVKSLKHCTLSLLSW